MEILRPLATSYLCVYMRSEVRGSLQKFCKNCEVSIHPLGWL
nr:MAG TPA: 50S ribosomal protein L2 [Caudoviricetes sp.]